MKTMMIPKADRFLTLWLVIMMVTALIFAPAAVAVLSLGFDTGGGSEGDPLDGNDYSSGGLTGDEVGENDSVIDWGSGGWVILLPSHDTKMCLIVDFRGAIPVLQMFEINTSGSLVEDTDAR